METKNTVIISKKAIMRPIIYTELSTSPVNTSADRKAGGRSMPDAKTDQ